MATYKEIQSWVKQKYNFTVKPCWIAHVKEQCSLSMYHAWNRKGKSRQNPCPKDKIPAIKKAFKHFGMI